MEHDTMSLSQNNWYAADNGETRGPMNLSALQALLPQLNGDDTHVYGPDAPTWIRAADVPGLCQGSAPLPSPPPPSGTASDEIDFQIHGDESQFVEVTLDPNETMIAEAGALLYMTPGIDMQTVMGEPGKN